jgi:hypothetical protein
MVIAVYLHLKKNFAETCASLIIIENNIILNLLYKYKIKFNHKFSQRGERGLLSDYCYLFTQDISVQTSTNDK